MDLDFQQELQCATCGKNIQLKRCSRCRLVLYCNKQCQITAWPDHKLICRPPALTGKKLPGRFIVKVQRPLDRQFDQILAMNYDKSFRMYLDPSDKQYQEIDNIIVKSGVNSAVAYFESYFNDQNEWVVDTTRILDKF